MNICNNINDNGLAFSFKNINEAEEMMDRIIKEVDDYLKRALQQSFATKENKQNNLFKFLNNGKNDKKAIEFPGTLGINEIIPNLKEKSKNR